MMISIPVVKTDLQDLIPYSVGYEICEPEHSFGPYIRERYLIHYVVSGKGILYKDNNAYPVEAGEIFIIRPGEETTYTADKEDPWYYIWAEFSGKLTELLDTLQEPVMPYAANTFIDLLGAEQYVSMRENYIASKLFEMMAILLENKLPTTPYEEQVISLIEASYMHPVTVDGIAAVVNLDRRYLTRLFKDRVGMTISDYLIKTRLKHAARLLAEGHSVARAGNLVGYHDPFNFSKMFKKIYGISPSEFRKHPKDVDED